MKNMMRRATVALGAVLLLAGPAHSAADWASDPVMTGENCENLEWLEIGTFLERYYYSGLAYGDSSDASGARMMQHYAVASALINRSQVCLAEALELKSLADELREQQALLTGGTSLSKRQMKQKRKLTDEANAEIEEAAEALETLTPEQRDRFQKGSAAYMAGTYATGKLYQAVEGVVGSSVDSLQEETSSKSRFGLNRVKRLAGKAKNVFQEGSQMSVVFRGLKDHTASLYKTSQFLNEYGKQRELDLPEDATGQLGEVDDWI
ncbi:MAG: hypothetical protein AAF184_14290 [Pseudomonadota bacterium]